MEERLEREAKLLQTIFVAIYKSQSNFKTKNLYLDYRRTQIDPFFYASLQSLYGAVFRDSWNTIPIPRVSDKAILFVERRCHPNLEFCLQNAAYYARGYAMYIICSKSNVHYIQHICGQQLPNIHIHIAFDTMGTAEAGKIEYNQLLKMESFWNRFKEEHIITMETDCYLRKPIPTSIEEYDYVASKWAWNMKEPGGGGLSYRKRSIMNKICSLKDPSLESIPMQDCYVSKGCLAIAAKVPTVDQSLDYFTESIISKKSCGVHQWWTFQEIPPIDIIKMYLQCEVNPTPFVAPPEKHL
jgi:hypothetical protein